MGPAQCPEASIREGHALQLPWQNNKPTPRCPFYSQNQESIASHGKGTWRGDSGEVSETEDAPLTVIGGLYLPTARTPHPHPHLWFSGKPPAGHFKALPVVNCGRA